MMNVPVKKDVYKETRKHLKSELLPDKAIIFNPAELDLLKNKLIKLPQLLI